MNVNENEILIDVQGLTKTFTVGFRRRKVEAVKGISFQIHKGEIFGIVGPNGAGKTTTIKIITGLMRQSSGSVTLFGHPASDVTSREKLGYLPEGPYFYEHLKVEELLMYYGQLHGLPKSLVKRRADELIERVGLGHARGRPLKKFSKGMRQRAGLAQALINDPELVILDEPQSGLDPTGRKEVRELIFDLKERGKTVVFSSHILPDVEAVCDRVALFHKGELMKLGALHEVMNQNTKGVEILVSSLAHKDLPELEGLQHVLTRSSLLFLRFPPDINLSKTIVTLERAGGKVESVSQLREDLEDVFLKNTRASAGEEE